MTAIEFALVAPAFITVVAVCAEFTRISMMRNLAQNAAYESARYVMAEGATIADAISRAQEILGRVGTKDAKILINGSDGVADENGNISNQLDFNTQSITCTIEIPLKSNSLIIPDSVVGNTHIRADMTLRTERYRGYYDAANTP